jgi:hypothetical protein
MAKEKDVKLPDPPTKAEKAAMSATDKDQTKLLGELLHRSTDQGKRIEALEAAGTSGRHGGALAARVAALEAMNVARPH